MLEPNDSARYGAGGDLNGVGTGFVAEYQAVLAHAMHDAPREACGLLVRTKYSAVRYVPCANAMPEGSAHDSFKIDPRDWAAAEDANEAVIGIVHSHPNGDAHASDADRWMCYESGLPWFIVATPSGSWSVTWPDAPLPLLGRSFHHGVVDCYTLVRDYYRQELAIVLPNFERHDHWWVRGANGEPGDDLYRKHFAEAGFVDLGLPASRPGGDVQVRLHDVLLMKIRSEQENHAGVFIGAVHGVDCMLHHMYKGLSCREPWGGAYLNRCSAVLRHRNLL